MTTKLFLFNTTILTGGAGVYRLKSLTLAQAKEVIAAHEQADVEVKSAIGHESTAQIMSTLLGRRVEMCRDAAAQTVDSVAVCFKVKGRPPEGKILSAEEIEALGYEWFLWRMEPEGMAEDQGARQAAELISRHAAELSRLANCNGLKGLKLK